MRHSILCADFALQALNTHLSTKKDISMKYDRISQAFFLGREFCLSKFSFGILNPHDQGAAHPRA
jgi:hypothetical protein